jgi:flagellar motor switch protein FliM
MPYSMLEPIREVLDAGTQSDRTDIDDRWISALREEVNVAEVELESTLTQVQLSLRDILHMKPGDVIPIDMPEFVTLRAEHVPVFRGQLGVSNENLAIKIVEQVQRPTGR